MQMLCYKCGHSWPYRGKKTEEKDYITCPGCYYKIRVDKALIESPSEQKLLITIPKKKILPTKILKELPTTTSFERVYFPDGSNCLIHKDIAPQFKELILNDLQDKEENIGETPLPGFEPGSQEEYGEIKIYNEFTEQLQKIIKYKKLGEEATIKILSPSLPTSIQKTFSEKEQEQNNPFLNPSKEKPNFEIKIIPRNPIKILEHQLGYQSSL